MREILHGFNGAHLLFTAIIVGMLIKLIVSWHNDHVNLKDARKRLGWD